MRKAKPMTSYWKRFLGCFKLLLSFEKNCSFLHLKIKQIVNCILFGFPILLLLSFFEQKERLFSVISFSSFFKENARKWITKTLLYFCIKKYYFYSVNNLNNLSR